MLHALVQMLMCLTSDDISLGRRRDGVVGGS